MAKEIPDVVALSILSKLPMKSLKRFICIRKSFSLLLENSYFMSMFRSNFIAKVHSYYDDASLLFLDSADSSVMYLLSGDRFQNKVKLDLPPPFQEDSRQVAVLLGSGVHDTLCLYQGRNKIVLWNPATEEFNIIPPSPIDSLPYIDVSTILHGFGYDHVTDDYKVIRQLHFYQYLTDFEGDWEDVPSSPDPKGFLEIYSLRSNSWRELDIDMLGTGSLGSDGIYMNGVCHWLFDLSTPDGNDEKCLVSFNFSNESSLATALTLDRCDDLFVIDYLAVLNGSIAVISQIFSSCHISILGELGVKESWTKLFIVESLHCVKRPIGTGKNGDILFFLKKDEEVVWNWKEWGYIFPKER